MTSGRHGCKILGSHRSIFTDTANDGRKVPPTVVPECNYVRESHTCQFFIPVSRAGPRLLEIQNFLLPWQRDVTTFPLCPDPVSAVNETRLTAGFGAWIIHT